MTSHRANVKPEWKPTTYAPRRCAWDGTAHAHAKAMHADCADTPCDVCSLHLNVHLRRVVA